MLARQRIQVAPASPNRKACVRLRRYSEWNPSCWHAQPDLERPRSSPCGRQPRFVTTTVSPHGDAASRPIPTQLPRQSTFSVTVLRDQTGTSTFTGAASLHQHILHIGLPVNQTHPTKSPLTDRFPFLVVCTPAFGMKVITVFTLARFTIDWLGLLGRDTAFTSRSAHI